MTDKIEDWAAVRAYRLMHPTYIAPDDEAVRIVKRSPSMENVARYIMQHETAPVDTLLIEAREIGAGMLDAHGMIIAADEVRDGRGDHYFAVKGALAALKSREKRNG